MYLNRFSQSLTPLDMSQQAEFDSLKQSAKDLGITFADHTHYRSHNTVLRHQRFHFLEWGDTDKPNIILLHGSNQSSHSWDLVSLHLATNYHIYALDQRGHGDSEWSRGAHYSMTEMAADVEDFITELNIKDPIIIGHSMGGMVTLTLANKQPTLLKAITVVDIGPEVNQLGTKMIREFVGRNLEFDNLEEFLDRVEEYDPYRTREHIERTIKYNLLRRADGRYVTKHDRRRFFPETDKNTSSLLGTPSLEELKQLHLPVLIIRGGDSNVLVQDAADRFVNALPKGQMITVPDCGHNVASQNTVGFLAAVLPYLEAVCQNQSG
ncbi:MAG: alpha/beta hydrolase [Pseudomonadales bacterium]|nr:alpha/beta hydrolase [Pseudomonadales bacterium]